MNEHTRNIRNKRIRITITKEAGEDVFTYRYAESSNDDSVERSAHFSRISHQEEYTITEFRDGLDFIEARNRLEKVTIELESRYD